MAIDDDDQGFGDFIFAPPPPPPPSLNLTTTSSVLLPESSAMAPGLVEDDDWGDFIISSGTGGAELSSVPIPSDLSKKPLEKKLPPGPIPLSLFGEMEDGEGGESGGGLGNSDPVKKNNVVGSIDVNNLIADLYKPNGDSKPNGSAKEVRNGVGLNPIGLDSSWSWGNDAGFGNGSIANGTSESRGQNSHFDPLNLISNGSNMNGNLFGSNLNSGSNVANGNVGFDDEEDDEGWEFKAAESNEIAKESEQMKNQNGMLNSNPAELNASWNGANSDFSGWSTSANGVDQSSNWMNGGSVGGREGLVASDTWGFAVAGSNGVRDENIKNTDKMNEDAFKANFSSSSLSWDVMQHPDSNGMMSSLSGVNSDMVQSNPGVLHESDEFGDADAWAFKIAESDLQGTQVKIENGPEIQSSVSESSVNISNLGGGASVNVDLFAADWDTREGSSDTRQENHNLTTETEGPGSEDDWEFKNAELEPEPIDSSSKSQSTEALPLSGALPLSLFGDEEKDLVFHEVSLPQISAPETRNDNRVLNSSLSLNDIISSLYNEVEQTAPPASHLKNPGESNGWGPGETALVSTVSNGTEMDDYSWEFKDASSVPMAETEDSTIWSSNIELPDWIDLFTKLKEELCLIAYQHLQNIKRAREIAAHTGADLSVLDKEIQDLRDELSECSTNTEEDHLPRDIRLGELIEALQQPKFQAIESEYQLLQKLLSVQNDSKLTVQLLKKVFSVLKILTLASRQEQTSYVSTWSKMLCLCTEELQHGSMIWKQLLQENIQDQVLSRVEGKRYILALGEVYRVVEVLRCTARLYRPWILLTGSSDSERFDTMISECSTIWSSSGLEEALITISNGSTTLLDSITYLRNLEDATLHEIVFSGQGPICRISALNPGVLPGMDLVAWNGDHYFVKLVNLWTNLTNSDPPSLPRLHIGNDD
ncbi:hypothetical protein LINPERHAP1_LOCUS37127 [Linum perenne]